MQLKLEELQRVAKKTIKEEKSNALLREELFRVLGPSVMVSNNSVNVAEASNEQIDLLESTGRPVKREQFKVSVLLEASTHKSSHVRKLAARLLPEKMVIKMMHDPSSEVRHAAARRLPAKLVQEAIRRHPSDDELRIILRQRKLLEAGLPTPKAVDEPFDMYGDKPMGTAAKTRQEEDFSDEWYERMANKICSEYGATIEHQWEEALATRIVASQYAVSGVKIDRDKLLKAIYGCIESREAKVVGESSLRAIASRLRRESLMETAAMPVIESYEDPFSSLLESSISSSEFIERADKILSVKKSVVPAGIKKYRLGEGSNRETLIPVNARVVGGLNEKTERVLDAYVSHWNNQQSLRGEPYRINWGPHPTALDMVGFNMELK